MRPYRSGYHRNLVSGFLLLWILGSAAMVSGQTVVPDEVLDIFDSRCAFAGCHAGSNAAQELDLTEEYAFAELVNRPSTERSELLLVKPQDPAGSYLMMKLRGSPEIEGDRMPRGMDPLPEAELAVIADWIESLPQDARAEAPERPFAEAFPGLSLATLPTAETLEPGFFSYRIAHRWRGEVVDGGFANFFGLDAGAHMLTQLTFALSQNLLFYVGRSSENATFEFGGKWRLLRQKNDGSMPVSLALVAGVDWQTLKQIPDPASPNEFLSRSDSERFHFYAQAPLSKQLSGRFALLLVPGILLNGNPNLTDEDAIFTLGLAGRLVLAPGFSIFVESIPILAGDDGAATIGGPRLENGDLVINDAFTIGVERKIGGHVFHVYVTNSLGLATNQYMSGANFDFTDGDFRLGFNIYRILRLPF